MVLYRGPPFELVVAVGSVNEDCDIADVDGIAMLVTVVPNVTALDELAVGMVAVVSVPCSDPRLVAGVANVRFRLTDCEGLAEITLYCENLRCKQGKAAFISLRMSRTSFVGAHERCFSVNVNTLTSLGEI